MRTRKFEVPKELFADFFRKVDKYEMDTELLDISSDGNALLVGVDYGSADRDIITELEELIEDFNEEDDAEEEETEEEEEEDDDDDDEQ